MDPLRQQWARSMRLETEAHGKSWRGCYAFAMELHPDIQELLDAMRSLENHLQGLNDFWADNVRRAADDVAKSDAYGLKRFLSFFGGMGSLNDLVLHRDGAPLDWENVQFAALRRKAWGIADSLRHEIN